MTGALRVPLSFVSVVFGTIPAGVPLNFFGGSGLGLALGRGRRKGTNVPPLPGWSRSSGRGLRWGAAQGRGAWAVLGRDESAEAADDYGRDAAVLAADQVGRCGGLSAIAIRVASSLRPSASLAAAPVVQRGRDRRSRLPPRSGRVARPGRSCRQIITAERGAGRGYATSARMRRAEASGSSGRRQTVPSRGGWSCRCRRWRRRSRDGFR